MRTVREFNAELIDPSICSKQTLEKMQAMLEGVVENGTARNLSNENFRIAGKTGTAQIANEKYGYKVDSKVSYQASFVGYFPAENPTYSCIVVVNSPTSDVYYGNLVAGPVFREISKKVYATSLKLQKSINLAEDVPPAPGKSDHKSGGISDPPEDPIPYSKNGNKRDLKVVLSELNIPVREGETSDWVMTRKMQEHILLDELTLHDNLVPNVREMGVSDAVYLLENAGLKVVVMGRGKVLEQSIPPGSRVEKGQKIILTMSFS